MSLWTEPLLEGGMMQVSLDSSLLIIKRGDDAAFVSDHPSC
jgi:hypothetical protein